MPSIIKGADYATFINVFRCAPENQQEVVRILIRISDEVAAARDGFISASTHASRDGTRVFNYLQWRTPEALEAMQSSGEFRRLAAGFFPLLEGFDEYATEIANVTEAAS